MQEDNHSISKLVKNDRSVINHSQIEALLAPYNFDRSLQHFTKTIFIYDIYNQANDIKLKNLHTFATLLTDPSLPLVKINRG